MAVESKPLFHPEVIRQQLRHFVLPASVEDSRPRLHHWANLIHSGQADKLKETDLLPDFLTDIFCTLLGYTRPAASPDRYTLSRETKVVVDGQQADAVLGRFLPHKQEHLVALEGKGTRDPLEIPFGGRKMSAVDQLPLRHQSPVRLDHRHLHAGDAALSQGLEPADLRALRHRAAGQRCRIAQAFRLSARCGPGGT